MQASSEPHVIVNQVNSAFKDQFTLTYLPSQCNNIMYFLFIRTVMELMTSNFTRLLIEVGARLPITLNFGSLENTIKVVTSISFSLNRRPCRQLMLNDSDKRLNFDYCYCLAYIS